MNSWQTALLIDRPELTARSAPEFPAKNRTELSRVGALKSITEAA
jgi:hypothetical protein